MRSTALLLAGILLTTISFGQRVRFKDLAPKLDSLSPNEQIAELWEYLTVDPNHGNANFRLSILHYEIFRSLDPLVEYRQAIAHAHEASLRLLRAKVICSEQDVRNNDDYYAPYFNTFDSKGRPTVTYEQVKNKLTTAYDSCMAFTTTMPSIYKAFTNSVIQYDKAVKIFARISTDYRSIEDLYMLFDEDLDNKLDQLKTAYDSSLIYFNNYLSLIKGYPLPGYNQQYRIREIKTFRLDGLTTRLNFLVPEVELWDYAGWVKMIRSEYAKEIVTLRSKVAEIDRRISDNLKALESMPLKDVDVYKPEKEVAFILNNYDKTSLALALLNYKAFKQHWLLKIRQSQQDTIRERKLLSYSELIHANRAADSLHKISASRMTAHNIAKQKDFLETNYNGKSGLERFIASESEFIDRSFNGYQKALRENLLTRTEPQVESENFVRFKNFNVPMFIQRRPALDLQPGEILLTHQQKSPDGSLYLAGVHRMNKKTTLLTSYLTKVNSAGKAEWLLEYAIPADSVTAPGDNVISDMVLTQEGCAMIITSIEPGHGTVVNAFVYINEKGEEKLNLRLKESTVARKLIYQEASNTFVIVFKEAGIEQSYKQETPMSVVSINVLGDLVWRREIIFAGTMVDIIPVRDGYIIGGNFTVLKDLTGKETRTRMNMGQCNPYLIKLSPRGDVLDILPVVSAKSICVDRLIKVNDNSIHLMGYDAPFTSMQEEEVPSEPTAHYMTTHTLKLVCSTF